MKRLFAVILGLCMLLTACAGLAETAEAVETTAEAIEYPIVKITVANAGDIYVELRPDMAPATVANFLSLVDRGFYDGLTFHRIISGFMVQGGDPMGNGMGGSEEKIPGEFTANGFEGNTLKHVRGTISMARAADMNSASSQFFIMHDKAPHLDGNYAAFGTVLAGIGVVDRLCATVKPDDKNGSVAKAMQPVITAAVRSDRAAAEEAAAAERANGRGGNVFTDPTTGMIVTLPEGWELLQHAGFMSAFRPTAGEGVLVISAQDIWAYSFGINAGDSTENGNRGMFNTISMGRDLLLKSTGLSDTSAFAEEKHGDATWLVGTVQEGERSLRVAVAMADGVFAALECDASLAEAMDWILDRIVLHPHAEETVETTTEATVEGE